ncbi:polysaccharide biosynthesis protein [Haloferax prahovense DSM 18310]|uniref:Polysaccharide biosynthesis protein n=1 Tax=Haloferax prahovense (strain DSM 18310 / JCM 13924 / TL6) TaxID=1227461 RepID=M0G259_HALPT|nr:oligosaccharide flippase family protein [Haloferax prahovense]ELZ65617.1 polysaccharide biosynthesis protein [Haloferax prahovense DSM 18310]
MFNKDSADSLSKFVRDLGWYSIAGLIPSVLGVIALTVFTRIFDPTAYGRYALAMVFVSVLSTGLFDWVRQAVLRYNSDEENITPTILSLLFGVSALVVLLGVFAYFLLDSALGVYRVYYFAALAAVISIGGFNVCTAIFQAKLQSRAVMNFKLIRGVLRHGLGFLISVYLLQSIVGWIWGAFVGSFLVFLLMVYELNVSKLDFDRPAVIKLVRYGVPMMGWLFGFTLLTFVDRILIEVLQDTQAVGIYTANYTLVQTGLPLALVPIIETVHPMIMERWNGNNTDEIAEMISKYSRYFLLIGMPAMVFAGIISRPLSYIALDSGYHAGFIVIPIIGVALFLWNFSMIGHKGLEVQDNTKMMTIGVTIAVLVNLGLNYLLIPVLGYIGAAAATLASSSAYVVFAYATSFRTVRWSIPIHSVLRIGFCSLVMVVVGYGGYLLPESPVLGPIISAILSGGVYLILIVLSGELDPSEINQIRSIL